MWWLLILIPTEHWPPNYQQQKQMSVEQHKKDNVLEQWQKRPFLPFDVDILVDDHPTSSTGVQIATISNAFSNMYGKNDSKHDNIIRSLSFLHYRYIQMSLKVTSYIY
jgi:hypothetical protein